MSSTHQPVDPKKAPLPYKAPSESPEKHHATEWTSGSRGGGKVPADLRWPSNPKKNQEEDGSGGAERSIDERRKP